MQGYKMNDHFFLLDKSRRLWMIAGLTVLFSLAMSHPPSSAQDLPRTLYALNGLGRTLSKVNLTTGVVENDILTLGDVPNRIKARNSWVYVVNSLPPGISVIDTKTDQVTRQIALPEGSNPWTMAFVGLEKAYVSNLVANTISVVDLQTGNLLNTIAVGVAPEGILVTDSLAYVTNTGGWPAYKPSTVSVIHTATDAVIKTLTVAANPQDLALAPDGLIHVICTGNYGDLSGRVYVIDPTAGEGASAAVVDSITVGGSPGDIIVTRDSRVFIPDYGDGNNGFLYVYDALSKQIRFDAASPLRIGSGAMNAFYDPATDELFINNFDDDAVQRIDVSADTVIQTFPMGDGVVDMVVVGPLVPTAVVNENAGPPDGFELRQNYPNPFNPSTRIPFILETAGLVEIRVYDVRGSQVRKLADQFFTAGRHTVRWDGLNKSGYPVGSGVYLYELRMGQSKQIRQLLLLR